MYGTRVIRLTLLAAAILWTCCVLVTPAQAATIMIPANTDTALWYPLLPFFLADGDDILPYGTEETLLFAVADTGASGSIISRYTRDNYVSVPVKSYGTIYEEGIGGFEYGDLSEPLTLAAAGVGVIDVDTGEANPDDFFDVGPLQLYLKIDDPYPGFDFFPNIIGTPFMMGHVMVVYPGIDGTIGLSAFTPWVDVFANGDPAIPDTHFEIPFEMIGQNNMGENGDWHTVAENPFVPNVTIRSGHQTRTGTLLFDTGGAISLISQSIADDLGLTDNPPEFSTEVLGVGGSVVLPGYTVRQVDIPMLDGHSIRFEQVPMYVLDVAGLDGVLGMNMFIDAPADFFDLDYLPFEYFVIDLANARLGVQVAADRLCGDPFYVYSLADFNQDCQVNWDDFGVFAAHWRQADCGPDNNWCDRTDIDQDQQVGWSDFGAFGADWQTCTDFASPCLYDPRQ